MYAVVLYSIVYVYTTVLFAIEVYSVHNSVVYRSFPPEWEIISRSLSPSSSLGTTASNQLLFSLNYYRPLMSLNCASN